MCSIFSRVVLLRTELILLVLFQVHERCAGREVIEISDESGRVSRILRSNCQCWKHDGNPGKVDCKKTSYTDNLESRVVAIESKDAGFVAPSCIVEGGRNGDGNRDVKRAKNDTPAEVVSSSLTVASSFMNNANIVQTRVMGTLSSFGRTQLTWKTRLHVEHNIRSPP